MKNKNRVIAYILGDLHLRTSTPNALQTIRTKAIKKCLIDLTDKIFVDKPRYLVLNGDIYDTPYVELGYEDILVNFLFNVKQYVEKVFIICGNHDSIGSKNIYKWMRVGSGITIVDKKCLEFRLGNIQFTLVPWYDQKNICGCGQDTKFVKDKIKNIVVVGHIDLFDGHQKLNEIGEIIRQNANKFLENKDLSSYIVIASHNHKSICKSSCIGNSQSRYVSTGAFVGYGIDENTNANYIKLITNKYGLGIEECFIDSGMDIKTFYYNERKTILDNASEFITSIENDYKDGLRDASYIVVIRDCSYDIFRKITSIIISKIPYDMYFKYITNRFELSNDTIIDDDATQFGKSVITLFTEWLSKQNLGDEIESKCLKILSKVSNKRQLRY